MKLIRRAVMFAIFVVMVAGAALSVSKAAPAAADDASVGIKSLIDGFTAAFNGHDAQALAILFTEDADFISVQQANSHSRKGIEEHFVPLFSGRLKNAHRTYTVKNIRFISPEVASVTMDYVLTGTVGANGEQLPPRKGLYDWIVVRQNGKWMISVLHESELAPAAAVVPVR